MANFPVGTRVQDPATGWTGTVVANPANPLIQNTQVDFVPNYNSTLIAVQWDDPAENGNKIPGAVFVSNSSVVAI
jgi:hypothetical protein